MFNQDCEFNKTLTSVGQKMIKEPYRLPNGEYTKDVELVCSSWEYYTNRLEQIFTGYKAAGLDPGIEMILWGGNNLTPSGIVLDKFTISVQAADILFEKLKLNNLPKGN